MIIVTPYLVRPVSNQLATPADGYRAPDDSSACSSARGYTGKSGAATPTAIQAAPISAGHAAPVAAPGFKL